MANRRTTKRQPGAGGQGCSRGLVTRQGTGESPRSGRVQAVRTENDDYDARALRRELPAITETAARDIHVLVVSRHGATPPPWRRLEVPSAITLDRLHEVLQETFGWSGFDPHSFVTIYGEFGGPMRRASPAARAARRDELGVTLAQAADEEGLGIVYLYGFNEEWRLDILVENILTAAPGVAYPRCTGGQGNDLPGHEYDGVWEFNADRGPIALEMHFDPDDLTEDLADMATVIIRT